MRNKTTSLFALALLTFFTITSVLKAQFTELQPKQGGQSDSIASGFSEQWLRQARDENGNRIQPEENEGDAFQRRIFNGFLAGGQYGGSVSCAGDVNGDGYDDMIVGAANISSSTGKAYIYFGGFSVNTVPDVILSGEALANNFGISVSSAGDVNADGFDDVIVGASGYSGSTGRAYLYFGGNVMNNVADLIMTGEVNANFFGNAVAGGDVNGDGYSDMIVGAFSFSSSVGKVYVFFGGASPNNTADVTMLGAGVSNLFGCSVAFAGDVNSDGFGDVLAGARGVTSSTGKAYVFFGGVSMDSLADVTMTGEAPNHEFGFSVSSAGDVNSDGFGDVIIGSDFATSLPGKAYLFYGGSSMDNNADLIMNGEANGDLFGHSVSSAGDVNGDGYSDLIIGAYGNTSNTGKAYIFFGGAVPDNSPDATMAGESTSNQFGIAVSNAGDMNGDGYGDVIAGASQYSTATGRVYLYDYFMKGEIIPDLTLIGEVSLIEYGQSVASAGDVNSDGFNDIIVGAPGYNFSVGRAYIYFGGTQMNATADLTLTGEASNNHFGTSVASAGDINGDGFSDVIVGAYGNTTNTGKAYIYFGGSTMNNTVDVTLTGEATNNYFGTSVSGAGDVNGDGYTDVIVGAYGNTSNTGKAYIFHGGSTVNSVADITMTGEATTNFFGGSVSNAGDVNNDGFSDVIVGANGYSTSTGRAYIYFGDFSMNNTADVVLTGELTNNDFGTSVSSAGDVNRDGFSDVVVGAPLNSSGTGRAYVFLGGSPMNSTSDVTMSGEVAGNNFGATVSFAGDLNADNYSDIIVGATSFESSIGRTYVFFGSSTMNNTFDAMMNGDFSGVSFGSGVSAAGDVNADGYSDVIVGAMGYSRAYIYNSSSISAKPILFSVKDVPNDQGGKISVKWMRSSFDVVGIANIVSYAVYRSDPPVAGHYSWEEVDAVSAAQHTSYSYIDNTPFDSITGNPGNLFYKIRARTANASVYWESAIMSGRSVDNLAPLMVSPFTAVSSEPDVRLTWNKSHAPDILNYVLYRSVSPTIDPETEPVFAVTTDSTYLDTSPMSGVYYYFITAQDIHNNKSPVAVTESPGMLLNLTMFIEGFYDAGNNSQVSDTITVELRNSKSPFAIEDVAKAVVSSLGNAAFRFGSAPNGNYYVTVRHRNSVETWSAVPKSLSRINPSDFILSLSATQAFGGNQKLVDNLPLRYAILSGDVNQDGTVDGTDVSTIDNDASNFVSGYVVTDLTGDEFVDGTDFAIADNNAANFVSIVRP
jgi:hypothetical protein